MRNNKPITVNLGRHRRTIDERIKSGSYSSASEVVRAALRALDKEENAIDNIMRAKVQAALNNPRPNIPLEDVFDNIERKHENRLKQKV